MRSHDAKVAPVSSTIWGTGSLGCVDTICRPGLQVGDVTSLVGSVHEPSTST